MKIYKHTGEGHYIGSCVIVIAENAEAARIMIFRELNENGLGNEPLNITEMPITANTIVYTHNGDY